MGLLEIVLALIVVGVLLWLINMIPMEATLKKILNLVVLIVVVVWLLKVFHIFQYLNNIRI